jgi:RHS repeat-associated protein
MGITSIIYNNLNLPVKIEFENSKKITYLYDANGTKLRKCYYEDGHLMETTDYYGMFVCKDDHIDYILTAEGRLKFNGHNYQFYEEYFIKDHLGNVRDVITTDPAYTNNNTQVTDYYPFGLEIPVSGNSDNQLKYNGKEFQDEAKLDWYDYGARFYDPVLGRFHSIDLDVEKYNNWTPYVYAANDPIHNIDVDGKGPGDDLVAILVTASVKVSSWFNGLVSYAEQTNKAGSDNTMNIVDASNQGLITQKAISDVSNLTAIAGKGIKDAVDFRIGIGADLNITKDNSVAIKVGIEAGTDGGKIFVDTPGSNSLEGNLSDDGKFSGNITLIGNSILGEPKDNGKTAFTLGKEGLYGKMIINKDEASQSVDYLNKSIQNVSQSYNIFNHKDESEEDK